jgi:hypothetical protein
MFETRPQNSAFVESNKIFDAAQVVVNAGRTVAKMAEIAQLRSSGAICYWFALGSSVGVLSTLGAHGDHIFSFGGMLATITLLAIPAVFFYLGKQSFAKVRALKNHQF